MNDALSPLDRLCVFFLFKQKTAYEMRISDWSSDVCSSDLYQARKESPEDESGNYAGREELRDGSLRYQAVDYHRDRRGHHDADRARDCNRADREIGIVAALTKLGHRHSPHGGGRCEIGRAHV